MILVESVSSGSSFGEVLVEIGVELEMCRKWIELAISGSGRS